ncbi:MAG: MFS transporter [Chlamydiia bacterium]|nr:MFS transporter [Chlamydiia bacterium]
MKEIKHPYLVRLLSIIGICLGCIVMGLVFTMINTAIPTIQKSLQIPLIQMQWMMLSFGIINCAFLVTSGRLADIYGRKKIFLIGLCCSGVGMFIGGHSQGSGGLIFSLSLAGLGNAILLPVSQAMLVSEFPESYKSRAIAIWASAIASAMALGPLVTGGLLEAFGWQWVFWSMIPLFLISLCFIFLFTRESKNTIDAPHVDVKGMILIGISLSSFAFLITEFVHLSVWVNGSLLFITVLSFLALWRSSRSSPSPILLPELVRKKTFLCASIASGCLIFYIWSTFFLLPIYLENVRHLSSIGTGQLMLGITIPVIVLSPIVGRKYQPHKAWIFIFYGFLCLILSSILQTFFRDTTPLPVIFSATLLFGIGYGLITGPTATAAISVVPPYKAGIASGTFVTFQEIGGTLGLALVVTAVRLKSTLTQGIQIGSYALFLISLLGVICSLLMKPRSQKSHDH